MKISRSLPLLLVSATGFFHPVPLLAQVDCFGEPTLSVAHLRGKVVDPLGEAVANGELLLIRGEENVLTSTTNSNGEFSFKAAPGKYKIHVRATGFSTGFAFVSLGADMTTVFHSPAIYIVLGIGEWRPCPSATTSKKRLNRILSDYSSHAKRQ